MILLDPALPLFAFNDKDHKLDPSDAEFVDVYHTNVRTNCNHFKDIIV